MREAREEKVREELCNKLNDRLLSELFDRGLYTNRWSDTKVDGKIIMVADLFERGVEKRFS